MPSLISSDEIACFTGALNDHFDTFKIPIVVHREPKKIIQTINAGGSLPGYNNSREKTNVTYVPETGIFDALVTIPDEQSSIPLGQLQLEETVGEIRIEVKSNARDYIKEKKVEKIVLDVEQKTYNLMGEDAPKNFLGLRFYVFKLKETL